MISILRRPSVVAQLRTQRLRRRVKRLMEWLELERYDVAVVLTDDAEIAELNLAYRNKNGPTDVLSFSQLDEHDPSAVDECLHLGDIVISLDTAARQAQQGCMDRLRGPLEAYGPSRWTPRDWGLESEVLFLVLHGLLHLRGYDHVDPTDATEMEALEAELAPYLLSRFPPRIASV